MIFGLQTLPEMTPSDVSDKLERRILDCWSDPSSTPLDLSVLLRQWMRRDNIRRNGAIVNYLVANVVAERVGGNAAVTGIVVGNDKDGNIVWSVKPWVPDWVRGTSEAHPVDFCSGEDQRREIGEIPADMRFERLGYRTFKTNGQFAAVQGVRAMAEGSTTVVMLPTGSGKTEVALALIEDLEQKLGYATQEIATVIVVPYVVLAKDLERRLQDLYKTRHRFAYTHDMSDDQKQAVIERIEGGEDEIPGIIITSPESLVGKLRDRLFALAKHGRLGAIVVDEAHLLYQSGVDFRLDFREVAKFRERCCEIAREGKRPRTLLMSATIGETELRHFVDTFGPVNQFGIIDAITARDEPDIFIAVRSSNEDREIRLKEALEKLPRPVLIYVTKPDHAKQLLQKIRGWGFGRVRCVVAETSGSERSSILRELRTGSEDSRVDLVVANSAFGLGIDCDEIRSVVHVCLPETIDRWYQEIGRGGRDGRRSVGLLLPDLNRSESGCDYKVASSLSPTTLEISTFKERWKSLLCTKLTSSADGGKGRVYLDLRTKNGAKFRPELSEESNGNFSFNVSWNRTILFALQEGKLLTMSTPDEGDWAEIRKHSNHWDWIRIELHQGVEIDDSFETWWNEYRLRTFAPFKDQLDLMWSVASGEASPCEAIHATYEFASETVQKFKPSLRGDRCDSECGHCSSCLIQLRTPQRSIEIFPKMSVAIEPSTVELVRKLSVFWDKVPHKKSMTSERTKIYPVFVGDIDPERLLASLRLYVDKHQGWFYDENTISPDQIWGNSMFPQVPMWAVTPFRQHGNSPGSLRSLLYRADLIVPPLIVLLSDEVQLQNFDNSSNELYANAQHFAWKTETQEIFREVLGMKGQ
jgi:ATP-dependent DNA helicase RecQ